MTAHEDEPSSLPEPERLAAAFTRERERVTDADVGRVLEHEEAVVAKARRGPLARFLEELRLLFALLRDYWTGAYREVPWRTIAAVAAALLYVLDPFDLIPDVLPIVGQVDDAAVLALCLDLIRRDLDRYRAWRETR